MTISKAVIYSYMHLFITLNKNSLDFRTTYNNGEGGTVTGTDPVKSDADMIEAMIRIINHYGEGCTVEIRDDR